MGVTDELLNELIETGVVDSGEIVRYLIKTKKFNVVKHVTELISSLKAQLEVTNLDTITNSNSEKLEQSISDLETYLGLIKEILRENRTPATLPSVKTPEAQAVTVRTIR